MFLVWGVTNKVVVYSFRVILFLFFSGFVGVVDFCVVSRFLIWCFETINIRDFIAFLRFRELGVTSRSGFGWGWGGVFEEVTFKLLVRVVLFEGWIGV